MTTRVPPVSVVAFDLDGTLVDSMTVFPTVYADTIRAIGGPAISQQDVLAALHVGSTSEVLAHFLQRACTPDDLECFYDRAAEAAAKIRAFPGVAEMLAAVCSARTVGVVTGAARRTSELLLDACGLVDYFQVLVAGDEVNRPKPSPDGLLVLCEAFRVPPATVAYVGDSQVDIDCALAAGCMSVHAGWAGRSGVINAHAVATTPGDVLPIVTRLAGPEPRPDHLA